MCARVVFDLIEKDITKYGEGLLETLLKDRTTDNNIIWAVDDYAHLGDSYQEQSEIEIITLLSKETRIIQPRITKCNVKQNIRTREKGEVFTPSWVCNEQNNLIDDEWFGQKNIFNITREKSWIRTEEKIIFPKGKNKTWQNYVDARRLEVACGEAPYLVSRYDSVTGNPIELESRIGLLDRKLRVVNENTETDEEWLKWTERAYQSIYGFEFQGDNLLLARENLLYTYIDNMRYRLSRDPNLSEMKKIATIISWNIWQMNGITFCTPFSEYKEESVQRSLFGYSDELEEKMGIKFCKIKNWRSKTIVEYRNLVEGKNYE